MTKNVLSALFNAARELLRDFGALAALAVIYAALIVAVVLFVTTREASVFQIALTAACAVAAPVLFVLVAGAAAAYAAGESRPSGVVRRGLAGFLKVLLITIPVVALAVGAVWATNKLENRVRHDPNEEARVAYPSMGGEDEEGAAVRPKPPVRWAYVAVSAFRLFLLGVLLPLLAIHLWIVAVRDGLKAVFVRLHRTLARAFSARSVFTYAVGMIVFALIPYFLVTRRTPASAGWLELTLLAVRLAAAFALTLFGFVMTMRALARTDGDMTGGPALVRQPSAQPRVDEAVGVTS